MRINEVTKLKTTSSSHRTLHLPETFRALRHRNYRLWFIGQGISLSGSWMQTMAQQVLIYRLTGSAAALGLISIIGLVPTIPLALWGGSISDRFPKRTIIFWAQVALLVQALILAGLTWSGQVQVWHVYLLSFFLAAAQAIDLPARQAFTVEMVEGKEDLTNAIGLNSAMFNGARALGPALAGVVVAATGEGWAFFLNALTFLAVMVSLVMMRNLPQPHSHAQGTQSTLVHISEGFRFVVKHQTLMVLISLVAVSAFLSMPYNTLLPVFAGPVLGNSAAPLVALLCGGGGTALLRCQSPEALPLGLLYTAVGVGAFLGAILVASVTDRAPRGRLLTLGNLAFPLVLLVVAISRSFVLSLGMMLLIGVSFVLQNALANTLLQLVSPDELRGRIMSVYTLTFQVMMRMGGFQAGLMGDWLGAPIALGLGAVVSLVYGLYVAVRYPQVRKL